MRIGDRRNGSEPKEKMINPKAETLLKPAPKITRVRGNQAGISTSWFPFSLLIFSSFFFKKFSSLTQTLSFDKLFWKQDYLIHD